MPEKKKLDYDKLIEMVRIGTHQKDIIKTFGFSSASQLKNYYLKALMKSGKAPMLKSQKVPKERESQQTETFVNKRGSVIIQKAIIEKFGFNVGDKFSVKITKSGLSLKKQ